jgi:hypothetical protein
MNAKKHLILLLQASVVWLLFWLVGLPDYFQQYSTVLMGVLCTLLSVVFSLYAVFMLARCREEIRFSRALWLSFYYTVPFAIYDTLYCGWYLGLGVGYLYSHWYLTVFYFSVWLTFIPVAWLLNKVPQKNA